MSRGGDQVTEEARWTPLVHDGTAYQSLTVSGGSAPLRVIAAEPAGGPLEPAVWVHGMEEGWHVWREVARRVSGLRSFFLDLPWSGSMGSQWALDRTPVRDWIQRGLGAMPVTPRVLVAHSFGAMAVLDYLDSHGPSGVGAVVLISPFHVPAGQQLDWPAFRHYTDNFQDFLRGAVRIRQNRARVDPEVTAAVAAIVHERIGPTGSLEFMYLLSKSPCWRLEALDLPFLVLGGAQDASALPRDCETLAARLPRSELHVLPDCGHFSMIERADAVAELLLDFLGRSLGRQAPAERSA